MAVLLEGQAIGFRGRREKPDEPSVHIRQRWVPSIFRRIISAAGCRGVGAWATSVPSRSDSISVSKALHHVS